MRCRFWVNDTKYIGRTVLIIRKPSSIKSGSKQCVLPPAAVECEVIRGA